MHASLSPTLTPASLELTGEVFLSPIPYWETEAPLLGDCELEGGDETQVRYPGLEEEKDHQLGFQVPGGVQTRPQEAPAP